MYLLLLEMLRHCSSVCRITRSGKTHVVVELCNPHKQYFDDFVYSLDLSSISSEITV